MISRQILDYSKKLYQEYQTYRIDDFKQRSFSPEILQSILNDLIDKSSGLISIKTIGKSFEERPIRLASVGTGETSALLWSQMHGDESTATMAICDILNFIFRRCNVRSTQDILSSLTLHFLPMLNPDGAARFQRRTAQGIDMNRDAIAFVTPEARILKKLRQELRPTFGFNLHDQELSTVGSTREISAIGLLAPSLDQNKSENKVRAQAKHIAAVFASTMHHFIPGKITKYDDSFEPRAFGDNMQKWGTSTLLVESGHASDDPEKDFIRKLNFVGILNTLYAIATGTYDKFEPATYENLPINGKRAYDIIIRNVLIEHTSGNKTKADLGISYQVDTHSELPPKLVDVGDLHKFVGLKEIDGNEKAIPQSQLLLNQTFEWEKYFL